MDVSFIVNFLFIFLLSKAIADNKYSSRERFSDVSFSTSSNEFGFKLGKEISRAYNGNIIFSPISIFMSLAMVQLGSKHHTRKELSTLLKWDGSMKQLQKMKELNDYLTSKRSRANFSIANRIWVAEKVGLSSRFEKQLWSYFNVEAGKELFGIHVDKSRKNINEWVAQQTNEQINELFPYGSINPTTVLVLANVIYFKGFWSKPFNSKLTKKGVFHLDNGRDIQVPYMFQNNKLLHGIDTARNIQLVEVPYERDVFSILFAIPETSSIETIVGDMNQDLLTEWIGILNIGSKTQYDRGIDIFIPKAELSQKLNLNSYLRAMGIRDLFTPGVADLSGMSDHRLYMSQALHEARIKIDEEGTVATGATGVGISVTSVPEQIRIDRPFLFYIIHKSKSNSIIFSGKVLNPLK